jgi:hypothetical protein
VFRLPWDDLCYVIPGITQAVPVRAGQSRIPLQNHHMQTVPSLRPQALEAELSWRRDLAGYKVERFGRSGLYILGRGAKMEASNPLSGGQTFLAFARVDSPEKLLQFVELHGLLQHEENPITSIRHWKTHKLIPGREEGTEGENVKDLLQKALHFRELLHWTTNRKRPSEAVLSGLDRLLQPDGLGRVYLDLGSGLPLAGGGSFRPVFRPDTLLDGMLWQLALAVSGSKHFRTCAWCGSLFEVGPGSGRRAHSEYCSPEHRVHFNSRNRSRSARTPSS